MPGTGTETKIYIIFSISHGLNQHLAHCIHLFVLLIAHLFCVDYKLQGSRDTYSVSSCYIPHILVYSRAQQTKRWNSAVEQMHERF